MTDGGERETERRVRTFTRAASVHLFFASPTALVTPPIWVKWLRTRGPADFLLSGVMDTDTVPLDWNALLGSRNHFVLGHTWLDKEVCRQEFTRFSVVSC